MCRFPVKWCVLLCGVVAGSSAWAEFAIDRSAVSEKYWAIWNDDEQRKIDANLAGTVPACQSCGDCPSLAALRI